MTALKTSEGHELLYVCQSLGVGSKILRVQLSENGSKRSDEVKCGISPQGDGRSGLSGPLLPENKLNVFNMLIKDKKKNTEKMACSDLALFCTYQNYAITMLLLNPIENDFAILFRRAMEN